MIISARACVLLAVAWLGASACSGKVKTSKSCKPVPCPYPGWDPATCSCRPPGDAGTDADSAADAAKSQCNLDASDMTYAFKYSCQANNDCVVVAHTVDCCGTIEYVGVEADKQSAFQACEKAWDDSLPACSCDAGPTTAEDGKTVTDPSQVAADCTDFTQSGGICYTYVP